MVKKINKQELKLVEEKDKELFDRIAYKYMQKDIAPSSSIARKHQLLSAVRSVFKDDNLGFVIDIGCGIGASAKYLKGNYCQYLGIDHSVKEIDLGKKFNRGNNRAKFTFKNAKDITLPNKADTILSIGALHHMTNLISVVSSLKKVARSGAVLLIIEPYQGNILIQSLRFLRKKLDSTYSKDQKYFKEDELIHLFKRNGLKNITVDYQGFISPYYAQVVMNPQFITRYLSQAAIYIDSCLNRLPPSIKRKICFNIIISGKF